MERSFTEEMKTKKEGIEQIITAAGRRARMPAILVLPDGREVGAVVPKGNNFEVRIFAGEAAFTATYDPNTNSVVKTSLIDPEPTDGP